MRGSDFIKSLLGLMAASCQTAVLRNNIEHPGTMNGGDCKRWHGRLQWAMLAFMLRILAILRPAYLLWFVFLSGLISVGVVLWFELPRPPRISIVGEFADVWLSNDGSRVFTFCPYPAHVSVGSGFRVWDSRTSRQIGKTRLDGPGKGASSLSASEKIFVLATPKRIHILDIDREKELSVPNDPALPTFEVEISADDRFAQLTLEREPSKVPTVWLVDMIEGKVVERFAGAEIAGKFAVGSDHLIIAQRDEIGHEIRIWDTQKKSTARVIRSVSKNFALSRDGKKLVARDFNKADQAGELFLLEIATGTAGHRFALKCTEEVVAVFSSDGRYLATWPEDYGKDRFVELWDVQSGERLAAIKQDDGIVLVQFSEDSRFLLATSWANLDAPPTSSTLTVYDIARRDVCWHKSHWVDDGPTLLPMSKSTVALPRSWPELCTLYDFATGARKGGYISCRRWAGSANGSYIVCFGEALDEQNGLLKGWLQRVLPAAFEKRGQQNVLSVVNLETPRNFSRFSFPDTHDENVVAEFLSSRPKEPIQVSDDGRVVMTCQDIKDGNVQVLVWDVPPWPSLWLVIGIPLALGSPVFLWQAWRKCRRTRAA